MTAKPDRFRDVSPYPNNPMGGGADVLKYRFQWNFPILFSLTIQIRFMPVERAL